jgi:hypothetical protein
VTIIRNRRLEHGHGFSHHPLIVAVVARQVVTGSRAIHQTEEASIAVGAGPVRNVFALREDLDQIVVGDQRSGDGHAIAISFVDDPADVGGVLKAACAENGDVEVLFDLTR